MTAVEPTRAHKRRLWGAIRAEATRLNRWTFVGVGAALIVLFAFMGTSIAFMLAEDIQDSGAMMPPGMGEFIDVESERGLVAGLSMATDLLGILALTLWAAATASDYSTGWIRLLVQAEPRRLRLLLGKVAALTGYTLIGTAIATGVGVGMAFPMAEATGMSTELWSDGTVQTILTGWTNISLSTLIWGVVGFALAATTRSAVAAIAGGIGYLVVFEGLLSFASEDLATYLPGSIIGAIGAGGTADLAFEVAVAFGVALTVLALALSAWVFQRRDITS